MAKRSRFASLSIDALVRMRDEIGAVLSRKADAMKKELRSLGKDYKEVGRIAIYGKKKTRKASAREQRQPGEQGERTASGSAKETKHGRTGRLHASRALRHRQALTRISAAQHCSAVHVPI